ncbi:alpha-N-acetylglucosaminidase TIM-barrel domain-containing protein [Streptomyces sp. NPDC056401]|uniref:alpha-N-acetylglucosaminidase n=1 Tax=Streptomyces sp. NPDC056401 TaxID=3345809 RepID=UPI0035D8E273
MYIPHQLSRRDLLASAMTAVAVAAVPAAIGGRAFAADAPATVRSQIASARAAITRLAPSLAGQFNLNITPDPTGAETFTVEARRDRVGITATTVVALVSGFNWYLQNVAGGMVSRQGDTIPATAPLPSAKVTKTAADRDRYIYNYCVNGYTSPYWQWPEWEREIDLLAARGVNMALVTTGTEFLWIDLFTQYGYTPEEIRRWICSLPLQPWQQMGNINSLGPTPTWTQLNDRLALGQRIVRRMRQLGITPVLPGYAGMVPAEFAARNSGAQVISQGRWVSWQRSDWLATDTPLYADMAAAYYRAQKNYFDISPVQAVDLWHEGGTPGPVDIAAASRGVQSALIEAFGPDYRWLLQAWGKNPRQETLDAVDQSRLTVLSLVSTQRPGRVPRYRDAQWLQGTLADVGGRDGLFGSPANVLQMVPTTRKNPKTGNVRGTAITMEAVQNKELVQAAFSDITWESEPQDAAAWLNRHITARYGQPEPHALAAWQLLLQSCYANDEDWPAGPDSLFNANPSLTATKASPFAPSAFKYDKTMLWRALTELCAAAPALGTLDTYRHDLVDLARQVLVNRARDILPQANQAYQDRDLPAFQNAANEFLETLELTDQVLATHPSFLLEPWLKQAERWGSTRDEAATMRADAARFITTWGDRPAYGVENYANRDWSGLLGTLYLQRWTRFFDAATTTLRNGTSAPKIDWFTFSAEWAANPPITSATPQGDPIQAALDVARMTTHW